MCSPRDEARSLLTRLLGLERVNAEPAVAADLARLCGRMPLALRIAATHITDRPHHRIADYAS